MNGRIGNRMGASRGQVSTRDEACDAVEAAYDDLRGRVYGKTR